MVGRGCRGFNSKLVRLKAGEQALLQLVASVFQFQTGAIKRFAPCVSTEIRALFQFQTGAIKRSNFGAGRSDSRASFNSKLVRLKGVPGDIVLEGNVDGFNSKLVRLKVRGGHPG